MKKTTKSIDAVTAYGIRHMPKLKKQTAQSIAANIAEDKRIEKMPMIAALKERIAAMYKPIPAPLSGKLTYGCGCTYISTKTAYLGHDCPQCWLERHEAFTNE